MKKKNQNRITSFDIDLLIIFTVNFWLVFDLYFELSFCIIICQFFPSNLYFHKIFRVHCVFLMGNNIVLNLCSLYFDGLLAWGRFIMMIEVQSSNCIVLLVNT